MPEWKEMVQQLVEGHEIAARTAREHASRPPMQPATKAPPTWSPARLKEHEKTAWMLRSLLR